MATPVDLLLVNPGNRLEQFAGLNPLATVAQPLGIAMLAAFVREQGFSVAIIDAEANFWTPDETIAEIEQWEPRIVGLSAFTTKMTAAGKTLRLVKERMPHVKTMAGGHHPSAVPERTLREESVDFVIKGEGFFPVTELLRRLEDGRDGHDIPGVWHMKDGAVVGNGLARGIDDLDTLPFAAWDLLPMEKYRAHHWQAWDYDLDQSRFAVLYTSLGCPFSCDYCSVNVVYDARMTRYRSAEHVVAEMELLVDRYGVRHIEIIDDTFTVNYKRVETLCDAIVARGLGGRVNMWCFSRTDRTEPRFMEKMKRAGINWVFMGFESGNDTVLLGVHKKQTVDQIKRAVDHVHRAGIHIGGNYVFGLPEDTPETMAQTLAFAREMNTEYANFFVMMAYPGTRFHELAAEKGYPLPETWGQYGFFAPDALPMRNERLTPEDILRFRDHAFTEYFGGERYQRMVEATFGPKVLDFLRQSVLSKKLVRTRHTV